MLYLRESCKFWDILQSATRPRFRVAPASVGARSCERATADAGVGVRSRLCTAKATPPATAMLYTPASGVAVVGARAQRAITTSHHARAVLDPTINPS